MHNKLYYLFIFVFALFSCSEKQQPLAVELIPQQIETKALFQAVSFIDEQTTWLSGHSATFCRTLDGGLHWEVFTHESDTLQFRDLHALSKDEVILMSAGLGKSSQILKFNAQTDEWTNCFQMEEPKGFLNTIEFWDEKNGLAFGDSFDDQYYILATKDGGNTWNRLNTESLPKAGEGEGGFAASGTCISLSKAGEAYIGTGAAGNSKILHTTDYGLSWEAVESPLPRGDAAGIFSIRVKSNDHALLAGGDLNKDTTYMKNVFVGIAKENKWENIGKVPLPGTWYGGDFFERNEKPVIFLSSPKGLVYYDGSSQKWTIADKSNYWVVALYDESLGYAAGKDGRIVQIKMK